MLNKKNKLKKQRLARLRIAFSIIIICIVSIISCFVLFLIKSNNDDKNKLDDVVPTQTNIITENSEENSTSENTELSEVSDVTTEISEDNSTSIDADSTEATEITTETEKTNSELTEQEKKQYVLDNPDKYTEELIVFMNKYDQVINYVYNYKDRDSISVSLNSYDDETDTDFPLYIQWDERWGYEYYGDSLIGVSGCGPTSLAMVYEGLTGNNDQTPATICAMSEENGYYVSGVGTSWNLMTEGATDLGLGSEQISLYENKLKQELDEGHPIICSVREGDFTKGGHFIVITGYTDDGFIVNDPNSRENSRKYWEYSVLEPQIKNLWSFWD